MAHEYKIGRCTRRCAVSGRELARGESCYSALIEESAEVRRIDVAPDAWTTPPEGTIGWWKSEPADSRGDKPLAPNEVLLRLLETWASDPQHVELRYLLALLLIRRRVLRVEPIGLFNDGEVEASHRTLRLYCSHNDAIYEVLEATPDVNQAQALDEKLLNLLHADAA